ncbi:hypothetical protein [Bacteroides fragilis]|jgi:hypothetical protein|uniref:hypothetical protein n=1 Tax=Bacteroides fragilis TaxID=817 RepID=UPI0015F5A1A3|nr:hypothetical protein [Bacteroides fragilis]MBA5650873.1 hypothetical protein [Bacteroides fragilis]MCE9402878.1 hypothetical protein [Bacteroides fragilis]MCZ2501340.1 hypothetical protein [Bacteroides fragilis]
MNAPLLIKIIVVIAIVALCLVEKAIPFIREKFMISLSKSGYFAVVSVVTMILAFTIAYNKSQTNEQQYSAEDSKKAKKERLIRDAFQASKKEVKSQLKAPSTAKFATEFDKESKYKINDDESVVIQSYVDAQNSFGAMIRTNFRCTVDKYGKVKDLKTW